jgi:hypothetical protein
LTVAAVVLPESSSEEIQLKMRAFLVTKLSGREHQRWEYCLVGTMVVRAEDVVETTVSVFATNLLYQWAIRFTVHVSIKEGNMAVPFSLHGELYDLMGTL